MRFQCSQCQCVLDIDDCQPGELVACGQCSSAVTVPPTPTSPGAILGDFAIIREIGVGGMGTVYLAHQISLDRDVALKVLLPNFAEDIAFIQDFINEARAAASVNHPHIVQAYAVNSDQGLYYFAMEFVDGPTLKQLLEQDGPLPVAKVIDLAGDIISALDYAWQGKKIIHRDIKPDNIMITSTGQAKLADLGLARKITELNPDGSSELYGTPQYIAPELLFGHQASQASDIYSLGATLYHILTGQCPYTADQPEDIVNLHIFAELPPLASVKPDVPPALAAMIETMLAKRPAQRYAEYTELLQDFQRVKNNEMPSRLPAANAQAPLNPDLPDPLELPPETETGTAEPAAAGPPRLKISSGKKKFSTTSAATAGNAAGTGSTAGTGNAAGTGSAAGTGNASASATGSAAAAPEGEPAATGDAAPPKRLPRLAAAVILLLVVLAAGGAAAWFFLLRPQDDDAANDTAVAGDAKRGDDAAGQLAKVKAMIAEKQSDAAITAELARLAPALSPGTPAHGDFLALAAPYVEQALATAREPALLEKQQLWDRQVAAAKVAAERKAQEEAAKAEEERQQAEAEKARLAAEKAEQERQQELAARKQNILADMLNHASNHDYDAAQRLFASMAASQDEQPANWARQWLGIIERAEKVHAAIRNSGTTFAEVDVNMGDKRKWKVADITFDKIKITSMVIAIDSRGKDRKDIQNLTLDLRYLLPPQIVTLAREAARKAGYEGGETDASVAAYLMVRGAAVNTVRRPLEQIDNTDLVLADLETLNSNAYATMLAEGLSGQDKKQGLLIFNYLRATAPDQLENIPDELRQTFQK